MQFKKICALSVICGTVASTEALAITQNMTASVTFITPLSINSVVNADFGNVTGGVASTKYVIDNSGNVSIASGPGTSMSGGTKKAAGFTIAGSTTQSINIKSGSYTASQGVTPSAVTCKYGTGSAQACDSGITAAAPGSGTALTMGLAITTSGNEQGGTTATPSFTMTIIYN